MELCKKIQELRKQKGLTQEELAEILFVSRTAVSKWESGRGVPSIESLKAIAKFFSISVDQLLSGEEIIAIAEADHNQKQGYIRDLFFGLLDIGIALLLLFLPLFGQKVDGAAQAVSLPQLTGIQPYLKTIYFILVIATVISGALTLALQNCQQAFWLRSKHLVSLLMGVLCVVLFMVSQQPYAAVLTFMILVVKTIILLKQQ